MLASEKSSSADRPSKLTTRISSKREVCSQVEQVEQDEQVGTQDEQVGRAGRSSRQVVVDLLSQNLKLLRLENLFTKRSKSIDQKVISEPQNAYEPNEMNVRAEDGGRGGDQQGGQGSLGRDRQDLVHGGDIIIVKGLLKTITTTKPCRIGSSSCLGFLRG